MDSETSRTASSGALGAPPDSIRVQVTGQDIAKGWRGKPSYCPVALALRRGGYIPYVDPGLTTLLRLGASRWLKYAPSEATATWILRYDEQAEGEPFTAEFTRIKGGQ